MAILGDTAGLLFRIRADSTQAKEELAKFTAETGGFSKEVEALIGGLGTKLLGLGAIVTGIVAGAAELTHVFFELAEGAAKYGAQIHDAQDKTGLTAEELSALKFAADEAGSSLEEMTSNVSKFSAQLGQAKSGNEKAAEVMAKYGITSETTSGALVQAIKVISEMEDHDKRAAAAKELFKDRTGAILPVIEQMKGDLPGLIKQLKDMGLVLTNEDAEAADEFDDALATLRKQFTQVKLQLGHDLMPVFEDFFTQLSGWLKDNKQEVADWSESVAKSFHNAVISLKQDEAELQFIADILDTLNPFSNTPTDEGFSKAYQRLQQRSKEIGEERNAAQFSKSSAPVGGTKYVFDPYNNVIVPDQRQFEDPARTFAERWSGELKKAIRKVGDDTEDETKKTGKRISKATSDEMRKFFEDMGAVVTDQNRKPGTKVAGTDRISKHSTGEAVDVRTKDKTVAEIVAMIAKAVEAGYRVYDERLFVNAKGVAQPHLHVEANTLKASTFYKDPGLYGGAANLRALQELDVARRGKGTGQSVLEDQLKKQSDAQQEALDKETKATEDWSRRQREIYDETVEDYETSQKKKVAIAEKVAAELEVSDENLARKLEQIEEETLQRRIELAKAYQKTTIVGSEESKRVTREIKQLEDQLELSRTQHATAEQKRRNQEIADEKKVRAEKLKSWHDYIEAIKAQQEAQEEADRQKAEQEHLLRLQNTIQSGVGPTAQQQLRDLAVESGNAAGAAVAGVDALTTAFEGLGSALGNVVQAWVLYGTVGQTARQVTAQIIAQIAAQAAVKAVFELAEGFAMLALAFFGHPGAGPSATQHFIAAGVYASIAGITAIAGRAVAGDSFKKNATASNAVGAGRALGSSGVQGSQEQGSPYSQYGTQAAILQESRNAPGGTGIFDMLHKRWKDEMTIRLVLNSRGVIDVIDDDVKKNGRMRTIIQRA